MQQASFFASFDTKKLISSSLARAAAPGSHLGPTGQSTLPLSTANLPVRACWTNKALLKIESEFGALAFSASLPDGRPENPLLCSRESRAKLNRPGAASATMRNV
jgi:hypothetical protein